MKRLLIICGLAALLLVPAALAANTFPLRFILNGARVSADVSQQPGVTNTTQCVWDTNDYVDRIAGINSVLDAGATVTDSWCVVADASGSHIVGTEIASDSSTLAFSVQVGATSVAVAPVFDKRLNLWSYKACVPIPAYSGADVVANSNGGVGQMTQVGVTLTNSSRRQAKVRYDWAIGAGPCAPA